MTERSFRTKTGRCVIHFDRLVLERSGARGALANSIFGDSLTRARIFYGVLVLFLGANALTVGLQGRVVQAVLMGALALVLLRNVLKTRGLSATPVLLREAITRIEAKPPVPPVARGHFIVHFTENGHSLRRLVILPGVVEGGTAEFARAVELFKSEGLPVA